MTVRIFAQKPATKQAITSAMPTLSGRAYLAQSHAENSALRLPRTIENQAAPQLLTVNANDGKRDSAITETARFGHDFSRIPVHSRTESWAVAPEQRELPVPGANPADGESDSRCSLVSDKTPDTGKGPQAPYPGAAPAKKAGVDSFEVRWMESPFFQNNPQLARLRLEYSAKFTEDATHDPKLAEFRQNAFHALEYIDGPHKGTPKESNAPMHDDNYSRADSDTHSAVSFESNDNPGAGTKKPYDKVDNFLDKDDVIDYSFTAEQLIIDIGDGKVIARRGPHTATITGKHPRTFGGVPVTLRN